MDSRFFAQCNFYKLNVPSKEAGSNGVRIDFSRVTHNLCALSQDVSYGPWDTVADAQHTKFLRET